MNTANRFGNIKQLTSFLGNWKYRFVVALLNCFGIYLQIKHTPLTKLLLVNNQWDHTPGKIKTKPHTFKNGTCKICHGTHMYTHKHIHTHIHSHTHTHTYMHIHTYKQTYIHTHICTYILVYIHICIHTYIYTHIYTHIHTYIHIHKNTYMHTYMYTYIYTHIHTHTHVFLCVYVCLCGCACACAHWHIIIPVSFILQRCSGWSGKVKPLNYYHVQFIHCDGPMKMFLHL